LIRRNFIPKYLFFKTMRIQWLAQRDTSKLQSFSSQRVTIPPNALFELMAIPTLFLISFVSFSSVIVSSNFVSWRRITEVFSILTKPLRPRPWIYCQIPCNSKRGVSSTRIRGSLSIEDRGI